MQIHVEISSVQCQRYTRILSRYLLWSTLECLQFWKENVEKFEEKDFQILRVLLKLLEASRETRTLAVGCHDLGMFITNHPHGRSIVTGTVRLVCISCQLRSSQVNLLRE